MFIAALFTIAKLWNQPRCPTTDEWIKKMWYKNTMEHYSAIKRDEIILFGDKWISLEIIMLSEARQVQKDKGQIFSFMCGEQIQKINIYRNTNMIICTYTFRTYV
jgi:hypothetical protein